MHCNAVAFLISINVGEAVPSRLTFTYEGATADSLRLESETSAKKLIAFGLLRILRGNQNLDHPRLVRHGRTSLQSTERNLFTDVVTCSAFASLQLATCAQHARTTASPRL